MKDQKISYKVNTQVNTTWLREPDSQKAFLNHFDAEAKFILKTYKVVVEFVPISLNNTIPTSLRNIERDSNIQPHGLQKTDRIKPLAYRSPTQKVAHAIAMFTTREGANKAITRGLTIEGRKCLAHKQLPEPMRCFGCHSLDQSHLVCDCPAEHTTCGTCGESHDTSTCAVKEPNNFYCVNCKTKGHTSCSHDCKAFLKAREKLWMTSREARYKLYPIPSDPLTWVMTDGIIVNPEETHLIYAPKVPSSPKRPSYSQPSPNNPTTTRHHRPGKKPTRNHNHNTNPPIGTEDNGWRSQRTGQAHLDQYLCSQNQTDAPPPTRSRPPPMHLPSHPRIDDYTSRNEEEPQIPAP